MEIIPGPSSVQYEEVNIKSSAALTDTNKEPKQKADEQLDRPTHSQELSIDNSDNTTHSQKISVEISDNIALLDADEPSNNELVYGNIGVSNSNPIQVSELFTCVQRMKIDGEILKEFKVRHHNSSRPDSLFSDHEALTFPLDYLICFFYPLEAVSHCRDPQLQVSENDSYLLNLRPKICKS